MNYLKVIQENNINKTTDRLKYWSNKFNNRQYGNEITSEEVEQLKEEGITVVLGASDDLMCFYGSYEDEQNITGEEYIVYWDKNENELSEQFDRNYIEPTIKSVFDYNGMNINAKNMPYCSFSIIDGNDYYGNGIVFYQQDFIHVIAINNIKVKIKNIISKTGRIFNQEWLDKTYKILQLIENNSFKFQDINDSNFILRSSIVEKIIDNNNIIIVETKNTVYELEVLH